MAELPSASFASSLPFWCPDAKGGENVGICFGFSYFLSLSLLNLAGFIVSDNLSCV